MNNSDDGDTTLDPLDAADIDWGSACVGVLAASGESSRAKVFAPPDEMDNVRNVVVCAFAAAIPGELRDKYMLAMCTAHNAVLEKHKAQRKATMDRPSDV